MSHVLLTGLLGQQHLDSRQEETRLTRSERPAWDAPFDPVEAVGEIRMIARATMIGTIIKNDMGTGTV